LTDVGSITLRTGSTTGLSYVPGADSSLAAASQAVRGSNTAPCSSTTPGFLSVTGLKSQTTACFGLRGFGDGPGGSPSLYLNPNTDAAAGEALVLTLTGPLADMEFDSFTLDLEAVNVPTTAGGGPELEVLVQDSSKPGDPPLQTIPIDLSNANRVVSSPPNFRVPVTQIATPGDQLVLRPTGSVRFQLEGDTSNLGSTFTLTDVTDVVSCDGESATSGGATLTLGGGESCTPAAVFFEFDRETNRILLLKDPSATEFVLTVPWEDEATAYPLPATVIDYFDGAGPQDMNACDGTTATPVLPGDQIPSTVDVVDGWCVASQSFELIGDGQMQVTETLYGKGDPAFNRLSN
jgi:hypothetical protein